VPGALGFGLGDPAPGLLGVDHGCPGCSLGVHKIADRAGEAIRRELLCQPVVYAADDRVFAQVDAERMHLLEVLPGDDRRVDDLV
jgi:hypothetical protein